MTGIRWISSYLKSGNTWVRIFLENLRRGAGDPLDINSLSIPSASNRRIFDDAAGIESSDLTPAEILLIRPRVFRALAASGGLPFMKVHDAYLAVGDGSALFPAEATAGALYIVRNPLDVAVSWGHHSGEGIEWAIARMAEDTWLEPDSQFRNLELPLLSWSQHVLSWLEQSHIPVLVIRYEDLHLRPIETFSAIAKWSGLDSSQERVERAIEHSSFGELRAQEMRRGFKERPPKAESFFRSGVADGWKGVLADNHVEAIVRSHRLVMSRFGYLPNQP